MATLDRTFAIQGNSPVWVKEEATFGTEAVPAAADAVRTIGPGGGSQERVYVDNSEQTDSFDPAERLAAGYNPGEVSFPIFCKPAGVTAGATLPQGAAIYKSLFGRETIEAAPAAWAQGTGYVVGDRCTHMKTYMCIRMHTAASGDVADGAPDQPAATAWIEVARRVEYELLRTQDFQARPSCTVWYLDSHTLYRCIGTQFSTGRFGVSPSNDAAGFAQVALTGQFVRLRITGTSRVKTAANTGDRTLDVEHPDRYEADSKIKVGDTVTEYTVSDISGATLTFSTALTAAAAVGDVVKPSVPAHLDLGRPISSRLGNATLDGNVLKIVSSEININNNLESILQKGSGLYPDLVTDAERTVAGSFGLVYTPDIADYIAGHRADIAYGLVLPAGDEPGKIVQFDLPSLRVGFPNRGSERVRRVTINFTAYPTTAQNDGLKLTFE